jgi:hypothetical protein
MFHVEHFTQKTGNVRMFHVEQFEQEALLVPQSDNGIDAHRALCGYVAG